MITVYLDNMIWDFLFERNLDLAVELPSEEFSVLLTREAEFEIRPIPFDALKAFIHATIDRCAIRTDTFFGFYDPSLPEAEQRVAGWGTGRWASREEIAFIDQQKSRLGVTKRKTNLYGNEADISLAARSFQSVVLSMDKTGPLNDAGLQGGTVVSLGDYDRSGLTLAEFIKATLKTASGAAMQR